MTEQKQIEEMAREVIGGCNECSKCPLSFDCKAYEYATKFYTAGYRKPEWISVEERLPDPKEYDWVLVNVKDDLDGTFLVPHIAELRNGEWFGLGDFDPMKDLKCTVTHWMPLPIPPKGDEGE